MPFDGMSFGAEPPGRVGARIGGDAADHDGDDEARPKVTFSDTPHLRCRSRSASLPGPDDPHAAGPPISRAAAEEAGRLFLQDRHSRMSRGSARASKIPFAVPQSLRNRRPTLMGAVLDDSKDSVKLREGLEAMKRVNTLDLQTIHDDDREEPTSRGSWSKDTAAEKPRCHWICWGLGLTASMVVLLVFVTVMLVLLFYQQPILDMFLHSGPNVWSEPAADGSSSRAGNAYDEEDFWQHFELNEPLCGFISVTGLVFALVYASNYTDAQSRLNEIRNSLAIEAGGVHTAMLLVRTLDDTDP